MTESPLPGFVARDPGMLRLLELARRAAGRAASVLATGESGAGKSHLARCMHDEGKPDRPFVIIDCGNIPEGLAENELFGHEAGAYSGAATRRAGKFESADGGTALLDRVTELPLEIQGKLLRVLQERAFERVGGQQTVRVDVTIVATAGDDLPELVRRRLFREDLYYRLHVVHLAVPPLRERPLDVAPLARHFLERLGQRTGIPLALGGDALELLERHSWPGNVRELQNAVERAAVVAQGTVLSARDVEPALGVAATAPTRAIAELAAAKLSLQDIEKLYLQRVMESVGGRVGDAAEILGIHRKTLLEKRKKYGLP
jgi:DNA-binding NtrC family response regulator